MIKEICVERDQLKIKAKDFVEMLKKDPISRKLLDEEEEHIKYLLKEIKEKEEKKIVE